MYAYHKQLHVPTAVDHAVCCNFVSAQRKCVVVQCSSRMAVHYIHESAGQSDGKRTAKLEFFYATSLFGVPVSFGVVPSVMDGRDGLLLAFREAKMALLTFDIEQHDIRTSWIHNFEEDIRRSVHFDPLLTAVLPIVAVEPQRRIGAFISYGRYLSVISFSALALSGDSKGEKGLHEQTMAHAYGERVHADKGGTSRNGVVKRLFDGDLRVQVSNTLRRVLDATFLQGYYEGTLCMLYECAPRGTDGVSRCELVALSVSMASAVASTGCCATPIWRLDTIPSDALSLMAVPAPLGGVLVASVNQLLYARQSSRTHNVALNSLAFGTPEFPARGTTPLPVRIALDGARLRFLTPFQCLISLKNGELFVMSLLTDVPQADIDSLPSNLDLVQCDGTMAVRAFYFERCAASIFASCVCLVGSNLLLIGSRVANSLLLRFTAKQPIANDRIDAYLSYYAPSVKPQPLSSAQPTAESDDDDAFLYGAAIAKRLRSDLAPQLESDSVNVGDGADREAVSADQKPAPESGAREEAVVGANVEETAVHYDGVPLYSFAFALCDSLLNIAPCRSAALGETASLSDVLASEATRIEWNGEAVTNEECLELALACGAAKNGAIALLQRGVRPCIASTFPLDACRDVFTVFDDVEFTRRKLQNTVSDSERTVSASAIANSSIDREKNEYIDKSAQEQEANEQEETIAPVENEEPELYHRYLLISRHGSTMVLEASNDIAEVETAFCTNDETVAVGHIRCDERYLTLQVCRRAGLFLVASGTQLLHSLDRSTFCTTGDTDWHVLSTSTVDECCLLRSSQLVTYLVTVSARSGTPQLVVQRLFDDIACLSLYKDSTGFMRTRAVQGLDTSSRFVEQASSRQDLSAKTQLAEEDAFLYGVEELNTQQMDSIVSEEPSNVRTDAYWITLVRMNGNLELLSFVTPQLSVSSHFVCHRFASLFPLVAANELLHLEHDTHAHQLGEKLEDERCGALEVMLTDLEAPEPRRPFLLVRTADLLHVYEAYSLAGSKLDAGQRKFARSDSVTLTRLDSCENDDARNPLLVQFRRTEALMFVRGKKESAAEKKKRAEDGDSQMLGDTRAHLKVFRNIAGHCGVFVCGPLPYFVLLSPKGALRTLAMDIDGPVLSFAEFNNVNCPLGFLYFNKRCELRISVLPHHLNYETEWLIRKIPLKATPHFINYHLDSKTWALVTSTSVPCTRTWKVNPEGEKECETYERDDRFIFPMIEQFRLELRAPDSFEPVSSAGVEFDECENVTAMKVVNVRSQETVTRFKAVVALGTNYCYGEDVINRGRLFIVDIIEVVPEPGKPLTNKKLKIIHNELQKGPVTAIAGLNGYIVTAIGQKVYVWELKEDHTLDALAFIDTQLYTVSLSTLKNFILIGDIAKGVSVLRYQDEWRVLSFVSRELRLCEVYAVEYFVDQKNLGFVMTDHLQNVIWYSYDPESRDSYGGLRLVRKADFNLAGHMCTMLRIKSKLNPDFLERKTVVQNEKRHILLGATVDGSIHVFQPIPEKVYRRLNMLHSLLAVHIQHKAGCNPRALRSVVSNTVQLATPQHNVVDGELATQFFTMLNRAEQVDLAKRIGTTCEQLYDDIYDLDKLAAHF